MADICLDLYKLRQIVTLRSSGTTGGMPYAEHLAVQLGTLLLRYHARLHPAAAAALLAALLHQPARSF